MPVRGSGRETVEGRHRGEVEAGNRRLARTVLCAARQARQDLAFKRHVLADHHVARVRQGRVGEGDIARQGLQGLAIDDQGRVVVPHDEAVGDQLVHRLFQGRDLGQGLVPGGDQAPALGEQASLALSFSRKAKDWTQLSS